MRENDFEKSVEEYYKARENHSILDAHNDTEKTFLFSTLDNMDIATDIPLNIDINIMDVISSGEAIVQSEKDKKELLIFTFSAIALVVVFAGFCIFINKNIFIYVQIAIVLILPLSLIPLSYFKITKGEY